MFRWRTTFTLQCNNHNLTTLQHCFPCEQEQTVSTVCQGRTHVMGRHQNQQYHNTDTLTKRGEETLGQLKNFFSSFTSNKSPEETVSVFG